MSPTASLAAAGAVGPSVRIQFDPPLFLQRQMAVGSLLTKIANTPRFAGAIGSLLDAGCGEAQLLRRLSPCDDDLPLTQLTGIDLSEEIWDKSISEMVAPGGYFGTGRPEDRWRPVDITLLHGSFEELSTERVGKHDVIVSTEVVEHLDPLPLESYARTLLGKMQPKVCIVTTPNRDFNSLFDYLDPPPPRDMDTEGHYRPEIPYRMRHHDHRFEWNRKEFQDWATSAAKAFGYDVAFSGVGGIGRGLSLAGNTGDEGTRMLKAAAAQCGESTSGRELCALDAQDCAWDWLREMVKDDGDKMTDWGGKVRRVFGDCSQIAIFVIKQDSLPTDFQPLGIPKSLEDWSRRLSSTSGLQLVAQHHHTHNPDERFPPTFSEALCALMDRRLADLVPRLVRDDWNKSPEDLAWDARERARGNDSSATKGAMSDDSMNLVDDFSTQYEQREHLKLQGMKAHDIERVVVLADMEALWGESVALQRLCRFHFEVFQDLMLSSCAYGETETKRISQMDMSQLSPQETSPFVCEFVSLGNDVSIGVIRAYFAVPAAYSHKCLSEKPSDIDKPHDNEPLETSEDMGQLPNEEDVVIGPESDSPDLDLANTTTEGFWDQWSDQGSCATTRSSEVHQWGSFEVSNHPQNSWQTVIEWCIPSSACKGSTAGLQEEFQKYLANRRDDEGSQQKSLEHNVRKGKEAPLVRVQFWRPSREDVVLEADNLKDRAGSGNWVWSDEDAPDGWGPGLSPSTSHLSITD